MTTSLPGSLSGVEAYRPFAQVRLVALDIDGTIAARPNDRAAAQIRALTATLASYGVSLTLATGRAYNGAKPLLESILHGPLFGRLGVPVILYNGAVVVDTRQKRILLRYTAPAATVAEVIRMSSERGVTVLSYDCDSSHHPLIHDGGNALGVAESVIGWSDESGPTHDFNGLPIAWRRPSQRTSAGPATALLLLDSAKANEMAAVRNELRALQDITVTSSSSKYLEVRPHGVDKGQALESVARLLGLRSDQVLAVGDNDNDVEMLRWAGCGVVVDNASPSAARAAAFRSDHPAGAGVVETLRVVAHARRYFRSRGAESKGS